MKWNKKTGILALVTLFTVAMVLFPKVTEAGSKTAIIIWANSIVPVLLPFFIFSDFIKRTGDLSRLPARAYPFVVAFLSGYPMGAKVVGDLVCEGTLDPKEGRWVLSYSLVTGPAFLMGTIGAFLGSSQAALIVTAAHYGGALLNGLFWRRGEPLRVKDRKLQDRGRFPKGCWRENDSGKVSYLDSFTLSITGGFKAMAVILAYLILFMIGINLLEMAGLFSLIGSETISSFLKGLLEMTAGSSMIGACNLSIAMKTVLVAFLVSFGGFSVIGQSMSMAEGSGIGLWEIIKIKLSHGMLAGILGAILTGILFS